MTSLAAGELFVFALGAAEQGADFLSAVEIDSSPEGKGALGTTDK